MFRVEEYIKDLTAALQEKFGHRLLCVGLQGSYLRGEATEDSDIDIVVILDALSVEDLVLYKSMIYERETPEKSCGFICGKEQLKKWNPLEVCNFLHGTKDYFGQLSNYLPQYSQDDLVNFVKLSVGNLYHEICHCFLHADLAKNKTKLPYFYKNVFFILQSIYYLKTGIFYPTKKTIMENLIEADRAVMEIADQIRDVGEYDFEKAFCSLFNWCQNTLKSF